MTDTTASNKAIKAKRSGNTGGSTMVKALTVTVVVIAIAFVIALSIAGLGYWLAS